MSFAPDIDLIPHALPKWGRMDGPLTELNKYLRASVESYVAFDRNDVLARLCRRAIERYECEDYHTAAELFASVAESNNVLECAFLGAALGSCKSRHLPAARTYLRQALTLHLMLGNGAQATLYEQLSSHIEACEEIRAARGATAGNAPRPRPTPPVEPWYWRYVRRHPTRSLVRDMEGFDEYYLNSLVRSSVSEAVRHNCHDR